MRYTYDPLHRLIRREKGERVATWRYEGVLLKEHVNEQGLTTYYTYDRLGRVIAEETGGRKKTFGYDAMNRICRIEEGGTCYRKNL